MKKDIAVNRKFGGFILMLLVVFAVSSFGVKSAFGYGSPSTPAPAVGSGSGSGTGNGGGSGANPAVTVDNGATSVVNSKVTISLPPTTADQMAISNTADFNNASWEKYSPQKQWILTPGEGVKTVYVMFRDSKNGTVTKVYTSAVELKGASGTGSGSSTGASSGSGQGSAGSASGAVGGSSAGQVQYTFTKLLGYGSRGSEVTALQNALKTLGYYDGPVTGFFGPLTKQTVINFQKSNNIKPLTGMLGPLTRGVLNQK